MRDHYSEEAQYHWLSILLDAYHIIYTFVLKEIPKEEKRRGEKLACKKSCHSCCTAPIIDLTEIEIMGISWYSSEKLTGPVRKKVKSNLYSYQKTTSCPFLVDGLCSIYKVRPITCREFHVFGLPCGAKEDVLITRPHDIWGTSRANGKKVAMKLMPFFGINDTESQEIAFENGFIANISKPMHTLDLKIFYKTMKRFDPILLNI